MVVKTKKTKVIKSKEKQNDIQKIAQLLFDRTQTWAKDQGLLEEKKSKYSSKAKKFDKIISKSNFGCQEQGVRELIEELIEEKIPPLKNKKSDIEFMHGTVIVPLTGNEAGYTLGEPVMIKNTKGQGIMLDGRQPSGSIRFNNEKSIRPATIEEIEVLVESLLEIDNFSILLLGFILDKVGE